MDHIAPPSTLTLLVSDVPSGDYAMIGSGPTVRSDAAGQEDALAIFARYDLLGKIPPAVRSTLEAPRSITSSTCAGSHDILPLADSGTAVAAVHRIARKAGLSVHDVDLQMTGNTHEQARALAAALRAHPHAKRPALFLSAGETRLLVRGDGKEGRNQEFALVAALELAGVDRVALLAAGTDGTDGPTDAAGAFADGSLGTRAAAAGMNPADYLAKNDSYTLFDRTGDLLRTGPTGTNVMDLVLAIAF